MSNLKCQVAGELKCCVGCPHNKEHETKFVAVKNPESGIIETVSACGLPCGKDAEHACK